MTPEQDTATDLQPEVIAPEVKEEHEELSEQGEKESPEEYGKRVQSRINKEVRKRHDLEREFEKQRDTWRKDFESMASVNTELKTAVESMNKTAKVIEEQTKPKPIDHVKEIDQNIKELKTQRMAALDNADFKLLGMIDEQIDNLKDKKYEAKLERERELILSQTAKTVAETKKDTNGNEVNPTVQAWAEDTPWYNEESDEHDPIMHAAAIKMYDIVTNDPGWKSKTLGKQLAEIRRRTEEKFHYGKKAPPNPTVEGVGTYSTGMKKEVTLNDDQKYVAARIFPNLTPKEAEKKYAANLGL